MTEADNLQLRILQENRDRLEELLLETTDSLELIKALNDAAQWVNETMSKNMPYFTGAVVLMLADIAERIRDNEPVDFATAERVCEEILTLDHLVMNNKSLLASHKK